MKQQAISAPRPAAGDVMFVSFLAVVAMLFAGFTAAYLIRRPAEDWVPVSLPAWGWWATGALTASSVALELARRQGSQQLLNLGLALGLLFLAGQALSWRELASEGVYLRSTPHGAFYFMLSAAHGLHLLGGLVGLVLTSRRKGDLKHIAGYWHFMGLVWLYTLFLLTT